MINLNTKLKFQKHKFNIDYYEVDSITDFEYLIILLTIDANDKKITLDENLKSFTNGDNDLKLLMEQRFESMFKTKVDSFLSVIDQAKSMVEETKKLNPAKSHEEIYYAPHLDLYLHNNKLISKSETEKELRKPYKENSSYVFNKMSVDDVDTEAYASLDFSLSEKLDSFNVLNLENQNSKEVIDSLKESLRVRTDEFIDFDHKEFKSIRKLTDDHKVLTRKYGKSSNLTQIGEFESIDKDSLLEYDYSNDGKFILSEFINFGKITFVIENKYSFSEFRETKQYSKLLDLLINNGNDLGDAIIKEFIKNSNSLEEFEIIKNNNWYKLDEKRIFDNISIMNDLNINLINDELIVKSKFVDHHFNTNKVELYKFLLNFYKKDRFKDMAETKVLEILYSVYKKDSSLLNKNDYKMIESKLKEFNLVNETIERIINDIASMRSAVNSEIERLEGISKSINIEDSSTDILDSINSTLEKMRTLKRFGNFFVHIRDAEDKSYEKDMRAIKKENKLFIKLKSDLIKNQNIEFAPENLNEEYIPLLENMQARFSDTIKDSKKIK